MPRIYRITERIMADRTYQFIPEACDNHIEGKSLWKTICRKLDPEIWYSVADGYYQITDSGYKTFEMAMDVIITFNTKKPQNIKILKTTYHQVKL